MLAALLFSPYQSHCPVATVKQTSEQVCFSKQASKGGRDPPAVSAPPSQPAGWQSGRGGSGTLSAAAPAPPPAHLPAAASPAAPSRRLWRRSRSETATQPLLLAPPLVRKDYRESSTACCRAFVLSVAMLSL